MSYPHLLIVDSYRIFQKDISWKHLAFKCSFIKTDIPK